MQGGTGSLRAVNEEDLKEVRSDEIDRIIERQMKDEASGFASTRESIGLKD
jgi:hypothetical protein